MRPTRRKVLATTAATIALAGCTGGGGGDDGGTGTGTETGTATTTESTQSEPTVDRTVSLVSTTFDPLRATVDPGGTVEWVNEDGFSHDVTAAQFHDAAADWSFSESLPGGARTTYTFEEAGVYEYYCTIHGKGGMCGAVVVGDASLDASLPCEEGGKTTTTGGEETSGGDGTTSDDDYY
jgi:plastocyanin